VAVDGGLTAVDDTEVLTARTSANGLVNDGAMRTVPLPDLP
jgi:hypothetical protein